jgi:hypothetical protein
VTTVEVPVPQHLAKAGLARRDQSRLPTYWSRARDLAAEVLRLMLGVSGYLRHEAAMGAYAASPFLDRLMCTRIPDLPRTGTVSQGSGRSGLIYDLTCEDGCQLRNFGT